MKFIEIISIAGYSIEAVGVFVVILGSCISSVAFIRTFWQLPEGIAYRAIFHYRYPVLKFTFNWTELGRLLSVEPRKNCKF